ncbi:hypothetical protein [Hymenobacter negativus]|uniref:Uncharacterized protein n=1 Tax=Hymenobacter negativus TaxID=2795026 RepID=A0ABS3QER8_9BACT|nr:hypothetical protein [Hymenobacter negativus]MBO2009733.1 hypothetical protein [Hymenobacter negativus]
MNNLVNQAIPAKVLADALKSIREARALVAPYLISLTPEERAALPKMGDKSLAFVSKAAEYAQSLPTLMPQYLDVASLAIDAGVNADLLPLYLELNGFTTDVDSTRMEAGSEGYTASLVAYSALKTAASLNQPGAQAAVTVLEPRFAGQGRAKPKSSNP